MKIIKSNPERLSHPNIMVQSGDFVYQVNGNWIKWPDVPKGADCLCAWCDSDDTLYVATSHKDYPICVFDAGGNFLRSFGQGVFDRPHCLCRTRQGTFLVADSGNRLHTVQEITLDGTVVRTFGTPGVASNSGYNARAYEELVRAGKISIEEQKTRLIENTAFFYELDSIRRLAGPFNRPCCMAQASTGEYFAADGYGNCAVHKFDSEGRYVKSWGGAGGGENEYRLPHWVNIDKYDRVWVSDRENGRCHVYSTSGEQLYLLEGFWRLSCCCSDDKYVYLGELGGGLDIVDIDTLEIVAQFGFPGLNMFAFHSICTNSRGDIILSSIRGLRPIGNILRFERL